MKHLNIVLVGGLLVATIVLFPGCKRSAPDGEVETGVDTPRQLLNKTSTMLALAWVAYVNSGMEATPSQLQSHAETGIKDIMQDQRTIGSAGKWEVVWGPVTYSHDVSGASTYTDNTMVLLKGKDPDNLNKDMLVLSIAGTNFSSLFDWGDEDFDATRMVEWPKIPTGANPNFLKFADTSSTNSPGKTQTGNYISRGINTGLDILFNKMESHGKTIGEYLHLNYRRSSDTFELAVTGHSLGGGLSPAVALSLKENQGYWNPGRSIQVTTYPFAGQSQGNDLWVQHFRQTLGEENFQGYYNELDVVPKGFMTSMLNEVEHLYDGISPELQGQCIIGELIHCVKEQVEDFNYTSLYKPSHQFSHPVIYNDSTYQAALREYSKLRHGTCDAIRYFCGKFPDCRSTFARSENFGNMAAIQHLNVYIDHFQIQQVVGVITTHQQSGKYPDFFKLICRTPLFQDCNGYDLYCDL